ncbi:MAG: hypothetical protein V3U75_13125 [Methylococcaceae bacterium]
MKLFLALLLSLALTACNAPMASKCQSNEPGVISVEDNFTGQCVEIEIAKIRVVLDQGRYTYIEIIGGNNYKAVEDYDIVIRKRKAAYGRWK